MRKSVLFATLAGLAAVSPASAQSWGFGVGVEVGPQVFFGPPPVIYEAPPAVLYEEPTTVIVPAPRSRVVHMEAPEDVLDRLARKGYSDFGPIDRRGALYVVSAIDPNGNLVALDISIFTGRIEHSSILEARYAAPPPRAPVKPRAKAPKAPKPAPAAAPAKPAPLPAPKPAPASAPAKATVPPPVEDEAPAAGDAPSSTLRDRLHIPKAPAEEPAGKPDPLVVY